MEKPLTIRLNELKGNIIKEINNSQMHIVLIKQVLNEVVYIVEQEHQRITKKELEDYKLEENKMSEEQEE